MKNILNSGLELFIGRRREEIFAQHQEAAEVQEEQFQHLIHKGARTVWGNEHGYGHAMEYKAFVEATALSSYEEVYPWIERAYAGEKDVLWPGLITKFAKSSGTTNARNKYIPMTDESLQRTHYRGGKDMWTLYLGNYPDSGALLGKVVGIGGNLEDAPRSGVQVGDLSAIMMANMPIWAEMRRTPSRDIALMSDWDEKLVVMAEALRDVNVSSLAGVPTWTLLLIKKMIEQDNLASIYDVWPKLEVFFHGAVAFDPYRAVFREILGAEMRYLELYNATEGFFGIQDDPSRPNEMLLMLDYGIFYEFLPLYGDDAVTIADVELGVPYELIITTNGGLWRYRIGDVVEFTSLAPYRVKISGRTKHYINAFGEKLMVGNAEAAVAKATQATGALVTEYTAGPQHMSGDVTSGRHEWVFEFERPPDDLNVFARILDSELKKVNSSYSDKRKGDVAMLLPIVHSLPSGAFRSFLESRGEITGRNKVPRLANHRDFLEQLLTNR